MPDSTTLNRRVQLIRWPRESPLTVLEDFVLRVLEDGLASSDADIARILCLREVEVTAIMRSAGLKRRVSGSPSSRSLRSGHDRKQPDYLALGGEDVAFPPKSINLADSEWAAIDKLEETHGKAVVTEKLPGEQREWVQKHGARVFKLPISARRSPDGSWVFRCRGTDIPSALSWELEGTLPSNPKGPSTRGHSTGKEPRRRGRRRA